MNSEMALLWPNIFSFCNFSLKQCDFYEFFLKSAQRGKCNYTPKSCFFALIQSKKIQKAQNEHKNGAIS